MAQDKAYFIEHKLIRRLLNAPDKRSKKGQRDRPVLQLLSLGLRRSEVCALNVADFDPTGSLNVRTAKKGKPRRVKLTPEIVEAIQVYRSSIQNWKKPSHDPDALFRTMGKFGPYKSCRLTRPTINVIVKAAVRKVGANGQNITPHSFRHAAATHSLRQGVDLATVQKMLGHCDIKTTSGYLHAMNTDNAFVSLPWLKKKRRKR